MTKQGLERYVDRLFGADKDVVRSTLLSLWAEAWTDGNTSKSTEKEGDDEE